MRPVVAFMTRHNPTPTMRSSLKGYELIMVPQNPRFGTVWQMWYDLHTTISPRTPYAVVIVAPRKMWWPFVRRCNEWGIIALKAVIVQDGQFSHWIAGKIHDESSSIEWTDWEPNEDYPQASDERGAVGIRTISGGTKASQQPHQAVERPPLSERRTSRGTGDIER